MIWQVVEKVELFQQPAHEIAGAYIVYPKLSKNRPKKNIKSLRFGSGNFWSTSMEAVEKPLSVFQQPDRRFFPYGIAVNKPEMI